MNELNEKTTVKEVNKDKLMSFLEKINSKLNSDNNSNTNSNINIKGSLNTWMKEFANAKASTIPVEYNKQIFTSSSNEAQIHIEQILSKQQQQPSFISQLSIILSPTTTIPEKEHSIHIIDTVCFHPDNFISNTINIPSIEQSLINLFTVPPQQQEQSLSYIPSKEHTQYIENVSTSIIIGSLLCKRLISIPSMTNITFPTIDQYITSFTSTFTQLTPFKDFRLRNAIINNIGNIISYCLLYQKETHITDVITTCYTQLQQSLNSIITEHTKPKTTQPPTSQIETSHFSLETTKNILIEIASRLPITDTSLFPTIHSQIFSISDYLTNILFNTTTPVIPSLISLCYETLSYFYKKIPFYTTSILSNANFPQFKQTLLQHISTHLTYISPPLRYWIISFLLSIASSFELKSNEFFMHNILPLICLNRYLPVDGVKKISLQLWKDIVDMNGVSIIKSNYNDFLTAYVNELLNKQGEIEKEAACRCIQELIMKVYDESLHKDIVKQHYMNMINTVIKCCRSPNCNLREDLYINEVNILIKQHCFDNIIEVRDACAFALRVYIENNCSDVDTSCKSFYIKLISSLNNDTVLQNEVYPQLTKEIFECITSKQDFGFMRPVELYEVKDGAVHVIKELAGMKGMWKEFEVNAMKYEDLLMIVIDYLCKGYNFGLQNLNKKTIWECLGVLMLKIDKYDVEFYLDYVIDILIKELDKHIDSVCGYQAEKFVEDIVKGGVSKRMIKGKVRNKIKGNAKLENLFGRLLK